MRQLRLTEMNRAAAVPGLNRDDAYARTLLLPPIEEQKRIAAILDKAAAIRRKRAEAIRLADDFLKSTFLDIFGDPISNPKHWPKKPLADLCIIRRGASPRPIEKFTGGTVPWIKIGDCTKGSSIYVDDTSEKIIKEGVSKSVYLNPGSIIFANCGVSLGFARILRIAGCIHDGWLSFEKINDSLNKIFFLKMLNSITEHFRRIAPSGTQPNLNTGIMKNFEVPIPPINLQQRFADIVTGYDELTARYESGIKDTELLFDSIVQRAFRGDL